MANWRTNLKSEAVVDGAKRGNNSFDPWCSNDEESKASSNRNNEDDQAAESMKVTDSSRHPASEDQTELSG